MEPEIFIFFSFGFPDKTLLIKPNWLVLQNWKHLFKATSLQQAQIPSNNVHINFSVWLPFIKNVNHFTQESNVIAVKRWKAKTKQWKMIFVYDLAVVSGKEETFSPGWSSSEIFSAAAFKLWYAFRYNLKALKWLHGLRGSQKYLWQTPHVFLVLARKAEG